MKKIKRILAGAGAFLLLALYASTLFLALSGRPEATDLLKAAVAATIILPVLLYAYTLVYRVLRGRQDKTGTAEDDQ